MTSEARLPKVAPARTWLSLSECSSLEPGHHVLRKPKTHGEATCSVFQPQLRSQPHASVNCHTRQQRSLLTIPTPSL